MGIGTSKSNESRMVSQKRTASKESVLWTRRKRILPDSFDGRWHGGYGQQGGYNGAIGHLGSRDGGWNNYHGRGHMLPYACGNLGHHRGCGGRGHQPRCQDVFVQESFSNKQGIEGNHNGEYNGSGEAHLVPDGESHFTNNSYEIPEQGNGQYDYNMGFTSNEREYQNDLYFEGETNSWSYDGYDEHKGLQDKSFQNDNYEGFEENEPFPTLGF